MKYAMLLSLILALACNREDLPIKEPDVLKVMNRYHLNQSMVDGSLLKNALSGRSIFSKIEDQLDFKTVELFESPQTGILIYIIPFKDFPDKRYAVKVTTNKSLIVHNEFLYSRKMKDSNNGRIGILMDEEAVIINFNHGIRTFDEISQPDYQIHFTKMGFCQRQPNQTFKKCYQHEVDEFCDSFVSCVALATNPTVAVLIAASCTCNA